MLPDILARDLSVVFCGTAVGAASAARGHYYAGPGNEFWRFLFESSLTPTLLSPEQDTMLPRFGIGLTDLAKSVAQSHDRGLDPFHDVESLVDKMTEYAPVGIAFHGKKAAEVVSHSVGRGRDVRHGEQRWRVADARVFVVPSASAANREPRDPERRRKRLDGKDRRVDWFRELAAQVR